MPENAPDNLDPDNLGLTEELAVRWTRAQPVVLSFIRSVIRDFNDAEDVLQEVAAGAARNYAKSDRSGPFLSWAMGIARHKVADYQRKYYREKLIFNTEVLDHIAEAYGSVSDEINDRRQALEYCTGLLQPRGQQMLELRYTHDMSPQQVGDRVGMSGNAVAVSLHRIRKALSACVRKRLAKEDRQ